MMVLDCKQLQKNIVSGFFSQIINTIIIVKFKHVPSGHINSVNGDCFLKPYQISNIKIFSLLKVWWRKGGTSFNLYAICFLPVDSLWGGSVFYTTMYRAEKRAPRC